MLRTVAFGAALWVGMASAAHAQTLQQTAVEDAIAALDWQIGASSHALDSSSVLIQTRDDEAFLEGPDANEFMRISEGHARFQPDAVVLKLNGPLADSFVTYSYTDIGYVKMDDWDEYIDADKILATIRQRTAEANELREEGYPLLFVDGWVEKPQLNRQNAVAYWAISGYSDVGVHFINAKAIKLGRNGMSILVWVGSPEQFDGAKTNLHPALQAHRYQDGFKYADFQPGADSAQLLALVPLRTRC